MLQIRKRRQRDRKRTARARTVRCHIIARRHRKAVLFNIDRSRNHDRFNARNNDRLICDNNGGLHLLLHLLLLLRYRLRKHSGLRFRHRLGRRLRTRAWRYERRGGIGLRQLWRRLWRRLGEGLRRREGEFRQLRELRQLSERLLRCRLVRHSALDDRLLRQFRQMVARWRKRSRCEKIEIISICLLTSGNNHQIQAIQLANCQTI